ncbi:MAG TPA: imidazoleglycerol-phosphate dehydratase HisB [Rubricoccaceae bacterium]|jgi:imidazoleglycerol-phosphate dehydratase
MIDPTRRTARIARTTRETDVTVEIDLDATPGTDANVSTGIGFFDHMLVLFARHGGLGLTVRATGDLDVDDHHTVEDVGLALGEALAEALGDKAYVARYGHAVVPMDEALARATVDLSGRAFFVFGADPGAGFERPSVGALSTEMVPHFWQSVSAAARLTLHLHLMAGDNDHHRAEALFKAAGRAVREAIRRDAAGDPLPSTKGSF